MVNQQAARTVQGFADGGRRRFVTASSGVQRKKVKPCGISARAAQAARRQTVLGFADGGRRRFVTAGSGVQRKTFKPCAVWGPCCASLRSTPPEH